MAFGTTGTYLTGASSATANVPVPSSTAAGDTVFVVLYWEGTGTVTIPSGFDTTPVVSLTTSPSTRGSLRVYKKDATGSDSGTYAFTLSGGATWREAVAFRLTGRATGTSTIDVTPAAIEATTAATSITVPSQDTVTDGCDLIFVACNFNGFNAGTFPGTYTARSTAASGRDLALATRDNFSPAGATGTQALTGATNGIMKAAVIAVRPASSESTPNTGTFAGAVALTGGFAGARRAAGSFEGAQARTGSITGLRSSSGAFSGAVARAGSFAGRRASAGSFSGAQGRAGAFAGVAPVVGEASGSFAGTRALAGSFSGARESRGAFAGAVAHAGSFAGQAPLVDGNGGSFAGTVARAGSFAGARTSLGSFAGVVELAGAITGATQRRGSFAGAVARTGAFRGLNGMGPAPINVTLASATRRAGTVAATRRAGSVTAARRTTTVTAVRRG